MVDVSAMIAAITGAQSGRFNYFAEMETAGKCLEWVKDHIALDEVGIYMQKKNITEADDFYITTGQKDYAIQCVTDCCKDSCDAAASPFI